MTSPESEPGGARPSDAPAPSSAPSTPARSSAASASPASAPAQKSARKTKSRRKRLMPRPAPGTAPGTLIVDPNAPKPVIDVIAYGPDGVADERGVDIEKWPTLLCKGPVTWVNGSGLGDETILRRLGELFRLHLLALEDVVNVHQRAKFDLYPEQVFLVARMIEIEDGALTTD